MSESHTHPNVQYTSELSREAQATTASSIGYNAVTGVTNDPLASPNIMIDGKTTYGDLNQGYGFYIVDGYFRPFTDWIYKVTTTIEWVHFILSFFDIFLIYAASLTLVVALEVMANITNNTVIYQEGKMS